MTNASKNEPECHLAQRHDEIEREWATIFSEMKTCNEHLVTDKVSALSALADEMAELRRASKIGVMLREMKALHDRTFRPIREIMDRLPKPVEYDPLPSLAEVLAQRREPAVVVSIFIAKETPNE